MKLKLIINSKASYNTLFILLSNIWNTDKQTHFRLLLGGLMVLLTSLIVVVLPWLLKYSIDLFHNSNATRLLFFFLISYGFLWAASQIIMNLRQIFVYRTIEKCITKFNIKVFSKLLDLPICYHINNHTGSIINYIERAQTAIPNIFFGIFFVIFPVLIEIIIVGGILWYYYGFLLGFSLVGIVILYLLFNCAVIDWVLIARKDVNLQNSRASSYVTDILMNIEGVHYQFAKNLALNQCKSILLSRENAVVRQLLRMDLIGIAQNTIAGFGLILMTIFIGFKVIENRLGAGDFILFNGYLLQFLVPLNMVGYIARNISDNLTRMEEVIYLLNQNTDAIDSPVVEITSISKEIRFESVGFKYPNKTEFAIKDINFSLPLGKTTFIIGSNGSGKSTIAKLIYRLYEVSHGKILIQGKDIKDISITSLRKIVGIVPQEIFMFNASIYCNLVFGDLPIMSDLFDEVMEAVGIDIWIKSLKKGYDTEVGERGIKLSGGERQKIGIARILLRQPKILVLDEATSWLDITTEHKISSYLINSQYRNVTKLIITHNFRSIHNRSQVIFMQNGKIIDRGSHEELLMNSKYNKLYQNKT